MNNDIRNLTKWLNEGQEAPIDRQALARVLAMAEQQEPVVFYRCNGCGHAYEQVHPTSCDCMEAGGFDRVEYYTYPPAQRKYCRGDRLICLETEEYCVIHISGTDRQWVKFPDTHIGVYKNEQLAELFELLPKEIEIEQPAQQALDKKAENARELGLNYEPAHGIKENT